MDTPLAHLDRPFDYAVPAALDAVAQPGVRVRVRFAGQDVDAFVLERRVDTDHDGVLTPLRRVVSPEPVLTAEVLRLARAVADRYAGTLSDVLRLAVPPRHATVERETPAGPGDAGPPVAPAQAGPGAWAGYPAGPALLHRLAAGEGPRAVWTALPGADHWAHAVAEAAEVTLRAGRGVLVVLPDRRDVDRLQAAVQQRPGVGHHARLEADLGPRQRYRAFLEVLRGRARLVIGTRSAAFTPVHDLGLVVLWDDGDDSHAEPRAPYPHAREVLRLRAEQCGAALLVGGWSMSAESAAWLRSGRARPVAVDRAARRAAWPRVRTAEDAAPGRDGGGHPGVHARVPTGVWHALHRGLERGPVLVQVPRAGYVPGSVCARCRTPARCPHCSGPLHIAADGRVGCGWCARPAASWQCPHCTGTALRAQRVGVERTAEELGRAFPGTSVIVSRPDRVLPRVPDRPVLVLATSGVEPAPPAGYAAAVLLDGDLLLARPDLRAGEDAVRRWLAAAALVRPAGGGGEVVLSADPVAPAVQAVVRLDPAGFAGRELDARVELGLPPATCTVSVEGDPAAVAATVREVERELRPPPEVLGPIVLPRPAAQPAAEAVLEAGFDLDPDPVRVLLRVPTERAAVLIGALRAVHRARALRREGSAVRLQVDPRQIG